MRNGLVLGIVLLAAASASAQQPAPPTQTPQQAPQGVGNAQQRKIMAALRIANNERIVLDGRLDEAAWSRAVPAADFIQQDPDNGKPATEPTEVRITYNNDSLYMGVTCFDSDPDGWIGYQRRRDEFLQSDDRFMWNIDTFNNEPSGYFFEMNPSGLMADALRGATFQSRQWDGIWNAKVLKSGGKSRSSVGRTRRLRQRHLNNLTDKVATACSTARQPAGFTGLHTSLSLSK